MNRIKLYLLHIFRFEAKLFGVHVKNGSHFCLDSGFETLSPTLKSCLRIRPEVLTSTLSSEVERRSLAWRTPPGDKEAPPSVPAADGGAGAESLVSAPSGSLSGRERRP